MTEEAYQEKRLTEEGVREDLQSQPQILMKLAENALIVAENLRNNYFNNTTRFITHLRNAIQDAKQGRRRDTILSIYGIENAEWSKFQNEVVTFIDGGVGRVELANQMPIFLRVGSYRVKTGERSLAEREQFGYYPVILGDLEGGSKERRDFVDIVRITAELLGGLSALERTPDIRVLMFHGPLVYTVWHYMGHTPFTEKDIDLFLHHYAADPDLAKQIKEEFLQEARIYIYPKMTNRSDEWVNQNLFEPLSWMAYLYRKLLQEAKKRNPVPIIAGVVERSNLSEFIRRVLLERVFEGLRRKNRINYFNEMYGRSDLTSPQNLLDRLGYTDTLLMAMILQTGEFSEPWQMSKQYSKLNQADISLPGEGWTSRVNFESLKPGKIGFPNVTGCYVHVSKVAEPLRVEIFSELGQDQIIETVRRAYLYATLLPRYGFPVGLDVADKYAHVPNWLTDAYSKLIRYHLGVSLQKGEISDAELRKIIVQAIYMTHRDWLFRPTVSG